MHSRKIIEFRMSKIISSTSHKMKIRFFNIHILTDTVLFLLEKTTRSVVSLKFSAGWQLVFTRRKNL